MRRATLAAAVLGLMAATTGQARAGTIVNLSYYGRGGPSDGGLISTGTGSFSFASGLTMVGLADLASFNFTLEDNEATNNIVTVGLADLTSFSASVGPGPTLTTLALATRAVQGSDPTTYPREFDVSSLEPPDASTYYVVLGFAIEWTTGEVTITGVSVPEPSTLTMAVLGVLIVAGVRSRRRRARRLA
jgi:hypothetical protein